MSPKFHIIAGAVPILIYVTIFPSFANALRPSPSPAVATVVRSETETPDSMEMFGIRFGSSANQIGFVNLPETDRYIAFAVPHPISMPFNYYVEASQTTKRIHTIIAEFQPRAMLRLMTRRDDEIPFAVSNMVSSTKSRSEDALVERLFSMAQKAGENVLTASSLWSVVPESVYSEILSILPRHGQFRYLFETKVLDLDAIAENEEPEVFPHSLYRSGNRLLLIVRSPYNDWIVFIGTDVDLLSQTSKGERIGKYRNRDHAGSFTPNSGQEQLDSGTTAEMDKSDM